jgi:D-tagatose-1,6-bisphosphate aldolase subunit GatZ/KbaZ
MSMGLSLQSHLRKQSGARPVGIYSVCSAHPWVLEAAALQAREDDSLLLIESTSNQVNQFGGYTGMRPAQFRQFAEGILARAGWTSESLKKKLILGGDHLGPNPWRTEPEASAMPKATAMVSEYVAAGFTKIHLDASMALAGDPPALSDEAVAERAVALCRAAEHSAQAAGTAPEYIIGTEVPVPGGADHALATVTVTTAKAAEHTLEAHRQTFMAAGLGNAWDRVLGLVVQPGVEFDHDRVVDYDRAKARDLTRWLPEAKQGCLVFEAHSTDYQRPEAYRELVEDGFAILKVGPALTFAMREALYALADIEKELYAEGTRSGLEDVIEAAMLAHPDAWKPYYGGSTAEQARLRKYSYSDRVRYYWQVPEVEAAVQRLLANLSKSGIPESMLSRYLPEQYARVRQQTLENQPASLIVDKVRDVLRVYAAGC